MASAIGMDKWRTKLLWQAAGLPTPSFALLDADTDFAAVEKQLGLPIFVKPAREGSSIGMSKVKQAGGLRAAWGKAAENDRLVLAENLMLGMCGALVGVLVGILVALAISEVGIPMPPPPNSNVGYTASIRVVPDNVLLAFLVGVGATVTAALMPARKVSRTPIVDALRYNI